MVSQVCRRNGTCHSLPNGGENSSLHVFGGARGTARNLQSRRLSTEHCCLDRAVGFAFPRRRRRKLRHFGHLTPLSRKSFFTFTLRLVKGGPLLPVSLYPLPNGRGRVARSATG